ncbi:MAG: TIR domain-containing protein [Gammaproteobacteria bacterium]
MLSRDGRLVLIEHLAQRIRNAREDRLRESLPKRFAVAGLLAPDLEKKNGALEFLDGLADGDLLALRRELRIDFDPLSKERLGGPACWRDIDGIRLFISHKSDREQYAEQLSNSLRGYGFCGFVARYQIATGVDWREEVVRALFAMEAFVSLHTAGLSAAEWPMQEMGIAFGRQVPMLALVIDERPGGLMQKTQALKVSMDSDISVVAKRVAEFLRAEAGRK